MNSVFVFDVIQSLANRSVIAGRPVVKAHRAVGSDFFRESRKRLVQFCRTETSSAGKNDFFVFGNAESLSRCLSVQLEKRASDGIADKTAFFFGASYRLCKFETQKYAVNASRKHFRCHTGKGVLFVYDRRNMTLITGAETYPPVPIATSGLNSSISLLVILFEPINLRSVRIL